MLQRAARFQLFLEGLEAAPPASNHDQALALIADTLNAVEDRHSGVVGNPLNWESDGRMYPPQPDSAKPSTEFKGVVVYRNRAHRTLIGSNGAIQIVEVRSAGILLQKTGVGIPFFQPDS